MSTADQSIASQSSHLLAGQVQTLDPAEDNQVLGLLYEYETVQLNQGAFSRHVQFAGTERSALYVEEYGARSHNLGALRGDRLAFCLPIMETESRWWGRSISHGMMPMSHSGKTIHATFDAGQRHVVMILDRQWCLEKLSKGVVGEVLNIENIVNPLIQDLNNKVLILNLKGLEFASSKVIGYFASIYTTLNRTQRKIVFTDSNQTIKDILALVGLDQIIPTFPTLEEALSNYATTVKQ